MERYKVDNLKKGKETFEKYYGKVNDTAEVSTSTSTSSSKSTSTSKKKKVTMEDRRLEEGKRLFEKYGGPKTFNREQLYQHMQKKIAENQLAQEYASQKSTPQKSTLTPRAATTSRVSANGTRPYSDQEFTQMVLDYAKRTPNRGNQSFRSSTGLTYSGKQGTITFAQAQADPKYKEYVQKGSRNLKGYSDGFIGDLKAAAKVRDTSAVPDLRSEYMDNDEKEMYNYLLGKYGTDTADEFEKGLEDTLSARLRHDETKTVRDASRRNVLAGVGYNVYGAMESPKGYVYAATKTGIDKTKEIKDLMNAGSTDEYKSILEEYKKRNTPVDLNDPAFSGNAIMNASNEGIKQAIGGTPVRDFAIDTGLSMAQSVSRMPLGALNVVMAGGSAATDAYVDAANRGATGDQALLQGAAQGTAEGVGENFSLGKLKGMKEVPGKGAKAVIKNLAKQAIAEGSEEGATEIMNTITDKMIMGNKSNYDTAVNYYISQGMSKEQAQMRAYEEIAQNVGMAALGGATSGAIMGAGAQALGTFLQRGTMAQEYAEQRAITPEEQTAQQQAKEQRAPVASEGVSSMVQNTQNNAGAGSTAISDIPVSDENMPAASKIVPNAKENVSNINKNVTGINENVDDINENVTNINENVDNTSENVQNSISNIPEQMNTQTETNRQAETSQQTETSQQEETSLQAETSRPAENQQSEKTAERAHPDSVQESYAREYAENMTEETRRKEYIESHREDLNDIFSDLGENGRTAAVESYDPEVPVSQYRRAFNRYYDSGRYAADIGVAEKSALSLYLTGDQQLAAYKAGAQDRKMELDRMSRRRQQGPAHQGGLENLSQKATQAQQNLAESLGKRTGLKFILEDSLESGAVGEYEGKKGTIRISTNSENFLRTNSHELTHFIKENAPEHFTSYRDTVISAYLSAEGQTLEQMTESYEKAYEKHGQKLSRDEIMEEIAADATGKFWNDEEFVQKIARKDKTVAQKIVDFLSDMLDAIKSLIKNEHTGKAAETLAEQKDSFEKARNLWMDALDQASGNYKMGGGEMGDISIVFKKDAVASGEIQEGNFKDGVAAVILPTDASDNLKARLNQEGVNTILYDPNLPDARKKAISELKDVRFQIDDSDMDIDYDEVVRENGELRKINEELKNQLVLTKDYTPRKEDIRKYAKSLLREYNSTYSQEKLESNLSRFYEYIQKAERMDAQELANVATQIGRAILEKSQQTDQEQVKVYKNILQDIKGTPIYVPEEVRNNLDSEGGYNSFRKKYMGQITFRNAGVSVDAAYNELAGLHPDLFPTDIINPTDQLLRIADVLEESRPKVENPYGADIDEMSVFLGQEILDNKANIRNIPPTLADKIFAKANRTEQEYIAKRKEYEQKLREYRGNVREREQGRQDKKQIIRDVTKMQKWLLSPTDRDHVPESMRTAVAKFLSCVDYSSSRLNADGNETQRTREWNEAKKVYDAILKNNGVLKGETGDIYVEVDPDLVTKLDDLQSMAEGKKIEDFTPRELRTLRETVSAMKHSIEDANKMYTNKRYEKASEAAESTLREWQGRKNKKTIKALSAADKFLQVHMLDSFTAFDRLGKAATTVYQGLRDGFDTKMRDTRLAQEYMKKLKKKLEIGGKEIQEWTGNKAKRQTFQVSGGEISLTPAQVMSLYELNKRPQAREHLYNQLRGIRTQGVEREVTVKGKKLFKVVEANVPVAVTPSDVKAITDTLTPKQKALADGVVSFFTDQTAAWGNEVSMTLYGYKKFNAPNYFPIVVDKNEIAKTNADVSRDIQTLKNLGITKNTTRHAKNGLIIEDIFDVYTRQADQMGSYHSFVVPLSDFQKYYNFNDVEKGNLREQMERVYGKEMGAWVDAFLKDLNGVGSGERELTSNLLRNAKSAAVGWNLRTAIQQPTAYFRAAAEIDPKYLAQGLKLVVSKEEWTQVQKYSPIAWWKDQGFFDINTGRSMKSMLIGADTTREKMINKSMDLAGKGDELAWKRLWMATKAETAALHPELTVGSEEFLQKSGARFSEIIDKTQVVDSVFHRSWAMREQWTKFYTAFMSEPIKSYNMLYRAAMDIADSKEINGKAGKAEKTKFARVAAAYAVTGAITALAASIMDVVRDNDDDKGIIEKYLSALGGNIADNLNVLNLIPIAKDVVSMFGGNSAARMDMQGLQYLVYACNEMKKFVEGDSKYTTTGIMYKWISPLARMTGIPIANLLRDTGSVVDTALDIAGANAGDYWKTKRIYDISSADNVTMYAKKALKAYREGKKELGDRILSDLIEAGQSDKTVNSGVKRGLKNDPVIQEAAEAMMNWDLETYEEKVEEVADRGIDKELIVKAVDMVINKKKKDAGEEENEENTEKDTSEPEEKEEKKETPLYETSDANDALNAGEYDKANKILDKVVESKVADGKTKKEAISSVKSSFSSKYRKRYIAAGADERAKIEIELERLRVGGSRIFSSEDFARWRKNAKKK